MKLIPKEEYVLTRQHPHLLIPFTNESNKQIIHLLLVITRKSFSNNTVTLLLFTGTFLTGYVYSRLSRDEYARRRAYARYTNFMLMFDSFVKVYEHHWNRAIDFYLTFDHTFYMWELRSQKLAEWKVKRKLEQEIMHKQSEGDEVSQLLMQIDNVNENV